MRKITFYTLLGVVGTILITILFNRIFGFQLQSFSLWLIIPVGGIYVGIGAVSGLYYYYFKYEDARSLNWKVYLISLLLGLVAFLAIYYMQYLILNYSIAGERVTFIKYLQIEKESGERFFAVNEMAITEGVNTSKTINTIYFYLQILGVILGSLWGLFLKINIWIDRKS